jgi:predicted nucleic acid-binding protein
VIHLDTNCLIRSLIAGTAQHAQVHGWLAAGETLSVASVVWAEFLCGPLTPQQLATAQAVLPRPEPFIAEDAERAAALFNTAGRRRGSLADCMIAAVCLRVRAPLATSNVADFRPSAAAGVQIIAL